MSWSLPVCLRLYELYFFFHDTPTTEIYTLSLHDALPICPYYALTAVSLLYDHDLDLRNQLRGGLEVHGKQIALGRDGAWYPKHPILMPIVAVPFILLFGLPGTLILNLLVLGALALALMRLAGQVAAPWPSAVAAF